MKQTAALVQRSGRGREALPLAFRAELNETTPPPKSVREAADGPSEGGSSDREEEK